MMISLDLVALGGDRLLAQAADRQDLAGQGELARHREPVLDLLVEDEGEQGRRHRDARRGAVLGRGALGDMEVDLPALEVFGADRVSLGGDVPHVGVGDARRLLHDVAHLAGELEALLARIGHRLDDEGVAAHARPGEAHGHARPRSPLDVVLVEDGLAQVLLHRRLVDRELLASLVLEDDDLGELAMDLVEVLLEVAHPRLAGVALGDEHEGVPRVAHRAPLEAVLLEALRDEVVLGDLELLGIDVARQLDDLHPVDEGSGDRIQSVGRADEEDVGEIEGQVEVVVAEARSSAPGSRVSSRALEGSPW